MLQHTEVVPYRGFDGCSANPGVLVSKVVADDALNIPHSTGCAQQHVRHTSPQKHDDTSRHNSNHDHEPQIQPFPLHYRQPQSQVSHVITRLWMCPLPRLCSEARPPCRDIQAVADTCSSPQSMCQTGAVEGEDGERQDARYSVSR